ncbi:MAG: FtsX-like permease family protein [Candidatus Hodarchaeota archaeon]
MFDYLILLACGLGILYILVKNIRYIVEKQKRRRSVVQSLMTQESSSKTDSLKFGFRYARHYLRTHRKRAAVMLFGFIAATTIVTSAFLWVETAPYDVLEKSLENQAFSAIIRPRFAADADLLPGIEVSLRDNPLVETSKVIRQMPGLFGIEGRPDSFVWLTPAYLAGTSDFYISSLDELFIIPEDYLSYIQNEFIVDGSLQVSQNEVVISRSLATRLESRLEREISVGSQIIVGVAQRFPDTTQGEITLGDWYMHRLNVRIAGIYVRKPLNALEGESYSEDTLGDAIFISESSLPTYVLDRITQNENVITTRLFVRFNRRELALRGISNLRATLQSFRLQVEEASGWRVVVATNVDYLYSRIDIYESSKVLIFSLLIPSFFASFLFIIFVSRLLYQDRKEEIRVLGSRGASPLQMFYTLIMENLILALIGSIIGILMSISNVLFIAGTVTFMEAGFNWPLIWNIIDIMLFKPGVWIGPPLLCSAVLLFSVAYQINTYMKLEDTKKHESTKRFHKWITDNYLDVIALIGSYLILVIATLLGFIDLLLIDATWLAALLVLVIGIWIGLTLIATKAQAKISRPATYFLGPVLKNRNLFVQKNLQRRQTQVLALGAILVLAGSICLFSLSYPTTIQSHTRKTVNFTVGADIRIETEALHPFELYEYLMAIPEIINATPIFEGWGLVGERRIDILGVSPLVYATITKEKIPDPIIQQQWKEALTNLNNHSDGVIINSLIAQRYNLTTGDTMIVNVRQTDPQEFTIVGVFSAAPGFGPLSNDPETYTGNNYGMIIVSACSQIFGMGTTTRLCLCKIQPGTNIEALTYKLYQRIPNIRIVKTPYLDLKTVGFLSLTGASGILTFNFLLAGFIFFLGLLIFFSHIVDQRRAEYAIMRVCGAKINDLYKLISSEGLLIIGISFITSTILGLTFAWIYSKISVGFLPYSNVMPLIFDFPLYLLAPLVFGIGLMIVFGTVYPARRVKELTITEIIKNL